MKTKTKKIFALFLALLLAFFLRFYRLGEIPNGLQQDETSIGYNAYSILLTGKDEHGVFLPQNFQAFGEYKLPGYIYATVPSIALFGLTPFAIRFVSALSGFFTVVVVFFLTRKLLGFFGKNGDEHIRISYLPYITTLLFAINPWHLQFSRAAFEVTLANFFIILGAWLFLIAAEKKSYFFYIFSAIFFAGSVYTYNIARIFVFVLVVLFFFLFRQKPLGREGRRSGAFLVSGAILLLPFFIGSISHGGADSTLGTLISTSAKVQAPLLEFRSYFVDFPIIITKLFFNSWALTFWQYLENIAANFSISFFFITGSGNGIDSIGTVGQWYLFEIPLIVFGVVDLWKKKGIASKLIFLWIVSVILISALTREPPQATRTFFLVFPVTLLSGLGILSFLRFLTKEKSMILRYGLGASGSIIAVYLISLYFFSYYVRFPIIAAKNYRTGDRDLVNYLNKEDHFTKIIFDKKAGFIYTSLVTYLPYSPNEFQRSAVWEKPDSEGFSHPMSFGKYEFRDIDWSKDTLLPNTLIVTNSNNKPLEVPPRETIYYPLRPVVISVGQELMQYPIQDIAYVLVDTNHAR